MTKPKILNNFRAFEPPLCAYMHASLFQPPKVTTILTFLLIRLLFFFRILLRTCMPSQAMVFNLPILTFI